MWEGALCCLREGRRARAGHAHVVALSPVRCKKAGVCRTCPCPRGEKGMPVKKEFRLNIYRERDMPRHRCPCCLTRYSPRLYNNESQERTISSHNTVSTHHIQSKSIERTEGE